MTNEEVVPVVLGSAMPVKVIVMYPEVVAVRPDSEKMFPRFTVFVLGKLAVTLPTVVP